MMLIKSLITGTETKYSSNGLDIHVSKGPDNSFKVPFPIFKNLQKSFIQFLRYATFGYLHVFVHELSHAGMDKMISDQPGRKHEIKINLTDCTGYCNSTWKAPVLLAGPLGDILFSFAINIAALSSKKIIGEPLAYFFTAGATLWILGELWYTTFSDTSLGDFQLIDLLFGKKALLLSQSLIVTIVLLGLFCCTKLS